MEEEKIEDSETEPIIIKNDYLLKSELTTRIALLLFFGWLTSINLTPEADSLDELYRKMALGTAVIGVLWGIFGSFKMLLAYINNNIFIKIYKEKIFYEYVDIQGNIKTLIINKKDYLNIKWSFLPIFGELKQVVNKKKTLNDKLEHLIAYLPRLLINLLFAFLFYILYFFRIKKYIIISTDKYFIAIPSIINLDDFLGKTGGFATITLLHSLTIKNSNILKGKNNAK